ncbi:hypothetical protein KCP76_21260 [Salmonella enterica subsp. enterica serovar Weltevreden]|nr:hypothetical protein KCP76_21260 [Salmonella enterica subsp. enterica serovar Weltevreden]
MYPASSISKRHAHTGAIIVLANTLPVATTSLAVHFQRSQRTQKRQSKVRFLCAAFNHYQ